MMRNNTVVRKNNDNSLTFYSMSKIKRMLRNGEITSKEAAFMRGYIGEV